MIDTIIKTNISQQIDAAWELRNAGFVQKANDIYLKISLNLGVNLNLALKDKFYYLVDKNSLKDTLDFLLLDSSFLRSQLKIDTSNNSINELILLSQQWAPTEFHGRLYLQLGLNALATGQLSQAFIFFDKARKEVIDQKVQAFSAFNLIVTMKALGYSCDSELNSFRESTLALQNEKWFEPIQRQLETLQAQSLFNSHDLDKLYQFVQRDIQSVQTLYFGAWIEQLPIFDFNKLALSDKLISQRLSFGQHWLNDFRIRTVQCLLIEEDLSASIKLEDQIERLYLWVWMWLVDPKLQTLEKIKQLHQHIQKQISHQLIHQTIFQIYENASLWLGLFSQADLATCNVFLKNSSATSTTKNIFYEYERLLLNSLYSLRNQNYAMAKDSFEYLMQHPAHTQSRFRLPQLVKTISGTLQKSNNFGELLPSLENFKINFAHLKYGLGVDSFQDKIYSFSENQREAKVIQSESLTILFQAFKQKTNWDKKELVQKCFGISYYDDFIHDKKVANLLSQANRYIRGWAKFSTYRSHVELKGKLENIHLKEKTLHIQQAEAVSILPLALSERVLNTQVNSDKKTSTALAENSFTRPRLVSGTWLSRPEIEAFFRFSKATANRKINDWLKRELVTKKGEGKATRYKILSKFENQIQLLFQNQSQSLGEI